MASNGILNNVSNSHVSDDMLGVNIIIDKLKKSIDLLLNTDNLNSVTVRSALKYIQLQTRYEPDIVFGQDVVKKLVEFKLANVLIRILAATHDINIFDSKNQIAFKNVRDILSCIWNCSHKSPQLCEDLVKLTAIMTFCDEIKLLVQRFQEKHYFSMANKDKQSNEERNAIHLLKAYLSILHNVVRHCSDSRKMVKTDCLKHLLKIQLLPLIKIKVYLLLAYLIGEEDNSIITTSDVIRELMKILKRALDLPNLFDPECCYEAHELVGALNRLAINDHNKVTLGEQGAIDLYLIMLSHNSIENQRVAAAGLWILAFHKQNRQRMKANVECQRMLKTMATHGSDENIRRAARAADFVLNLHKDDQPIDNKTSAIDNNSPHVMISYNHSTQKTMIRAAKYLREKGFNVWMDIDHMRGSTLDAMSLAVEKAAVIIVCLCQRYQDSFSCRTEADYAYQLRKGIVPVLLEAGFVASGWLGCLIGTRLCYDLSNEAFFEEQMAKVVFDLNDRGLSNPNALTQQQTQTKSVISPISNYSAHNSITSFTPIDALTTQPRDWNEEMVNEWLKSRGVITNGILHNINGYLLIQLKHMYETAPAYFYKTLQKDHQMDLLQILKFSGALKDISHIIN